MKHGARRAAPPRWGQNFLVDAGVAEAIVEWADIDGQRVLEIGPGRGALTRQLYGRASRLTLVEIDPALANYWSGHYRDSDKVLVLAGDVLRIPVQELIPEPPLRVVANLPYESATAILFRLLAHRELVEEMVVMLQKEVCQRITAGAGSRLYGKLSVQVQLRADVAAGMLVPPSAFRPSPRVESQVLRIRPLAGLRYCVGDEALFDVLVTAAFAQRRKMIRNGLVRWLQARLGTEAAARLLDAAGVEVSRRPEELSLAQLARLGCLLHGSGENNAGTP